MNPVLRWVRGDEPCRASPESFFPSSYRPERWESDLVKSICAGCPSIEPCRETGIENRSLAGVWGGLNETERARARRQRRAGR